MKHRKGKFESVKFNHRRSDFEKYIDFLKKQDLTLEELLEHFTAYIGHMTLNRILTLYDCYLKTLNIAGHIAEVGIYKGATTLLFAKLVKIFENESLTQVHGFDWFEGAGYLTKEEKIFVDEGSYRGSYEILIELIKMQKLDHIIRIHKLDIVKELKSFFKKNIHLKFKLVFIDVGIYEVLQVAIPVFWDRLTFGGMMVFDHYSHELSPVEGLVIDKFLPNVKIRRFPHSWMPSAYAVKE